MVKNSIRKALSALGYEINRKEKSEPFSRWDASVIREFSPDIQTCFDVGVGYGTSVLYQAFPDAFHVLIEPLNEYRSAIERILNTYDGAHISKAVGEREGKAVMNVEVNDPQKSSFLSRTSLTSTVNRLEQREVTVTTLDALMEEHAFSGPYGVKIDTEGYELAAVKGGGSFLREAEFVLVELSLMKRFDESYTFTEFTEEMNQLGFFLYDVLYVDEYKPSKYIDAVFKPR